MVCGALCFNLRDHLLLKVQIFENGLDNHIPMGNRCNPGYRKCGPFARHVQQI